MSAPTRRGTATLAGLAVAGLLTTAVAVPAVAGTATPTLLTGPTVVTGPSTFTPCAADAGLSGNAVNMEVEPWLSVDPTNPANVVTAWQQDRWGDPNQGGAHGLTGWTSAGGGTSSYATFTRCSGGTAANHGDYDRASDVWLSFGPDGTLYQAALVFDWFTGRDAVTVATSRDAGRTWGTPVVVAASNRKNFGRGDDKESVTADPLHPGTAYVVWDRYSNLSPNYSDGRQQNSSKGPAYFSRTTDFGRTWSDPAVIYGRNNGTLGNQIVVLPDGTLLDFFLEFVVVKAGSGTALTQRLSEIASSDGGLTWSSKPVVIAPVVGGATFDPAKVDPHDPTAGYIRSGGLFDVAVAPAGTVSLVWQADPQDQPTETDRIFYASSADNGRTWSTPVTVGHTPAGVQQFTPSVDVSSDGTTAVTFYDFRNYTPGDTSLGTDYWVTTLPAGGTTWSQDLRLTTSSFDTRLVPSAGGGPMVGDYEGLDHAGATFWASYEVGNNTLTGNPTDIVVASFTP